jgi:tetratricopeptide (TPR) repeat protein
LNALVIVVATYKAIKEAKDGKPPAKTILLTAVAIVLLNGAATILERVIPGKVEQELKTIREEQREHRGMLGEVLDYLDGLPDTKNPRLKRLFEKGYALYNGERYAEAADTFTACLQLKTEDSERLALLILLGNSHHRVGKLKDAEAYQQEALLVGERIADTIGHASALGNLGQL